MNSIKWIALDWGTSNLRAYALDQDDNIIDEIKSPKGMSSLGKNEFEDVLIELIDKWLDKNKSTTVLACGMVGAKQGWKEASYKKTPSSFDSAQEIIKVETNDKRLNVYILPGVCQMNPSDVMRGEETQIAGFLEKNKNVRNICLPGTHTKWVGIKDENIEKFSTYMTGETFAVMSGHSILRFNINKNNWDENSFLESVMKSFTNPENLLSNCFRLRANSLVDENNSNDVYSSLLGLLIGMELLSTKEYWDNQEIVLIGDSIITKRYELALSKLGSKPVIYDSKDLTILGLKRVYKGLKDINA